MLNRGPVAFPWEEYVSRVDALKSRMAEKTIEILLVTDAANVTYLSGYDANSSYVAQGLIVALDQDEPTIFLRRQDAPAGLYTCYMARGRVLGYPEDLIGNSKANGFDFAADLLKNQFKGRRLGLELSSISAFNAEKLRTILPNHEIVDASGMATWLRIVKSGRELDVMRQAARITDLAMRKAVDVIRPGVRQCDAAAEITATLIRGTPDFGGQNGNFPLIASGVKTGTSHLTWDDTLFERNTHVAMELGGFRHSYAAGLMRTIALGKPSERLVRLYDGMLAGLEAALETARPGAACSSVATAFGAEVEKAGFLKDSRCGYPIGINWLESSASLRTDDPTVLQPNMTFHLMLGMWVEEDFGATLSETICITDTGCDALCSIERTLFVND